MDVDNSRIERDGTSTSRSGEDNVPTEEVDYTPLDRVWPRHGSTRWRWGGVAYSTAAAAMSSHR
jgi:hypothetical protein